MTGSPVLTRPTRLMTIGAVCLLHAIMLAWFLTSRGSPDLAPVPAAALQLFDLSVDMPPTAKVEPPPPPPALPSKLADKPKILAPPSPAINQNADAGAGGSCSTLTAVAAAINADPDAVTRIRSAPAQMRSVAGAIVIWNAGWPDGVRLPEDPLQRVRNVIEGTLQGVDQACLDEIVTGPRLIAVPNGEYTIYAVLGSGTWSWAQLLLPDGVIPPALQGTAQTAIPWPKSVPPAE